MPRATRPVRGERSTRAAGSAAHARREKARPRFGLYLALTLLAAIGLAVLLRAMLLTALASPLVVARQEPGPTSGAVLILDGDRRFEEAARLLRERPGKTLVFEDPPNRLILAALVPDAGALTRRELARHAITEPDVEVLALPGRVTSDHAAARALGHWLDEHPGMEVTVLCDAFSSGMLTYVFTRVLGERATRLSWLPLPDRRYSLSDWWQKEAGILAFVEGYASLLQARLVGDLEVPVRMIDASAWLASLPGGRPPRRGPAPAVQPAPLETEAPPPGTEPTEVEP